MQRSIRRMLGWPLKPSMIKRYIVSGSIVIICGIAAFSFNSEKIDRKIIQRDISSNPFPVVVKPVAESRNQKPYSATAGNPKPSESLIPAPVTPPTATYFGTDLDSRGYAPFIFTATQGANGTEMVKAAKVLKECSGIKGNLDQVIKDRTTQEDKKLYAGYGRVIQYYESQYRACQTIDAGLMEQFFPLLLKAAEVGEPGAAAMFFTNKLNINERFSPEEMQTLKIRLVQDAELGHESSIAALAISGALLGFRAEELTDYKVALKVIANSNSNPTDYIYALTSATLDKESDVKHVSPDHVKKLVFATNNYKR